MPTRRARRAHTEPDSGARPRRSRVGRLDRRLPSRAELAEAICCPFPLTINVAAARAQRGSLEWLARHEIVVGPRRRKVLERAGLTTLVAGFYPTASLPDLRLASDYVCWAFMLDDLADETSVGERPARLYELFRRFEPLLRGHALPSAAEPKLRGLHDVLERVEARTTRKQFAEFIEGNRAYFRAMLWEADNRASGRVPDEHSYLELRPAAGAVPSFFSLIVPFERLRLPDVVLRNETVRELTKLAGGIICWTNDVLSYDKEQAHADRHNLVMVYEAHRRLSLGDAAAEALAFINARMSDFLRLSASLPRLPAEQRRELERYVSVLGSVIRVTLSWTYESTRYASPEVDSGRSAGR